MIRILLAAALAVIITPAAIAQKTEKAKKTSGERSSAMGVYQPSELTWTNAPPALPAGAKVAVLSGDPMKAGQFTMRLMVPDGFKIAPHFHGADEQVTVISGTFNVGMGDKFDETAGREIPAGGFAFMPKGMRHYAWMKGETVVQINGVGPWTITYVNPSDDPRKAAAAPVSKTQ